MDVYDFHDMNVQEVYVFLAIVMQMWHVIWDTEKDYFSTFEQFSMKFCSNLMKHNWFFHILNFLHFSNNMNQSDKWQEV
jgi:hypothetical protein